MVWRTVETVICARAQNPVRFAPRYCLLRLAQCQRRKKGDRSTADEDLTSGLQIGPREGQPLPTYRVALCSHSSDVFAPRQARHCGLAGLRCTHANSSTCNAEEDVRTRTSEDGMSEDGTSEALQAPGRAQ